MEKKVKQPVLALWAIKIKSTLEADAKNTEAAYRGLLFLVGRDYAGMVLIRW